MIKTILNQKGLSLIELMIAMVIGLALTSGAIQIFISTKNVYRIEDALSQLQQTGRFIVDKMAQDIRMAGYNGCSSRGTVTVNSIAKAPIPIAMDGSDSIRGYNGSSTVWTPAIATNLNLSGVVTNTDVLNIQRADSCGAQLTATFDADEANIQVASSNGCGFEQNQAVLITDCINADVYQINSAVTTSSGKDTLAQGTAANSTNTLSKSFGNDAVIFRLMSTAYYVGTGASGEPAIFQSSWNPTADTTINSSDFNTVELADGVEDIQILYGEDTGGGDEYADTYVTANSVSDWERIRSVRINLLLRSPDRITSEPRSITFNGATVGGADNRLRMVYTSTVTLRNRLP